MKTWSWILICWGIADLFFVIGWCCASNLKKNISQTTTEKYNTPIFAKEDLTVNRNN